MHKYPARSLFYRNSVKIRIFVSSVTAKGKKKKIKYLSFVVWIKKLWHIHTMKYYAAFKKIEVDLYDLISQAN